MICESLVVDDLVFLVVDDILFDERDIALTLDAMLSEPMAILVRFWLIFSVVVVCFLTAVAMDVWVLLILSMIEVI